MKKILFFLLLISIKLFGSEEINSFSQNICNKFAQIWYFAPMEKVYLHTDKPYYSAGEDIWFKAYLMNASTHLSNTKSRFVYVELIDNNDSVFRRVKIRKDSLSYQGSIKLQPEQKAGTYTLRAYTNWMQNFSDDFYFKKTLFIGNEIDDRINCDISFGNIIDNNIPVTIRFTNTYKNPLSQKQVNIKKNWLKSKNSFQLKTNDSGLVSFQIKNDTINNTKRVFDISIKEPGINFKTSSLIPEISKDFDVQFFPESGALAINHFQLVGFKAIGKNGLSINITGTIHNQNNEVITEFSTLHNGMGKFALFSHPKDEYYALIKSSDGLIKRFELPKTQEQAITLQIGYNKGKILYQIRNNSSIPNDSLTLIVHNRGIIFTVQHLKQLEGQIMESLLPSGVCSFSVIDKHNNMFCERLYFSRNFDSTKISLTTDKEFYIKRQKAKLSFAIFDSKGMPLQGDYSVSITDSKLVNKDTLSDNISSYLLLSSDIKGYIEKPAEYFTNNSMQWREKLDLLMLTQGWKKYNTADLLKDKYISPSFYIEAGQFISGKVLNLFGKGVKNLYVALLSTSQNGYKISKTDSLGTYIFDGIEFPDSTQLLLKAIKKSKILDVEILSDSVIFKKPKIFIPYKHNENLISENYFQVIKEKYYTEGGMLMINLNELTVKADIKNNSSEDNFYAGLSDRSLKGTELENMPQVDILTLLSTFSGVNVSGEEIRIRGAQGAPLILIDNFETEDINDLKSLSKSEIEGIYLFKGPSTAIFGSRGGNGVIQIALKRGVEIKHTTAPSLLKLQPLGYQKQTEFYVPKYDVEEDLNNNKPDLRTTIYWNPKLSTNESGLINFEFYTADKMNNYNVELEGLGENGEICRFTGLIHLK